MNKSRRRIYVLGAIGATALLGGLYGALGGEDWSRPYAGDGRRAKSLGSWFLDPHRPQRVACPRRT